MVAQTQKLIIMENNVSFRDFVSVDFNKSMENTLYCVKQNIDDFKHIRHWRFATQEECLLAIALYLATPNDKFNINDFSRVFKFTLRMIGVTESEWCN